MAGDANSIATKTPSTQNNAKRAGKVRTLWDVIIVLFGLFKKYHAARIDKIARPYLVYIDTAPG